MMRSLVRRLHREDDGYALVIAILLLSVMMVLMVVSLDAANGSLKTVSQGTEWSKTLTIAEAGVNDVITLLGQSRTSSNPCAIGTGDSLPGRRRGVSGQLDTDRDRRHPGDVDRVLPHEGPPPATRERSRSRTNPCRPSSTRSSRRMR